MKKFKVGDILRAKDFPNFKIVITETNTINRYKCYIKHLGQEHSASGNKYEIEHTYELCPIENSKLSLILN